MKEIIKKVDRTLIRAELTADRFLRPTNKAGNEIYIITHHDSPHTMREIGRLREVSFRSAGGGTGNEMDIDKYDIQENPYKQLILWDPEKEEIIGGYRYQFGSSIPIEDGKLMIATARLFDFSEEFLTDFLPYTIELGRSFVQPEYQSSKAGAKALFALDNLWDGLGALGVVHPEIKYFFGKVTMYSDFHTEARDYILSFLQKFFPDDKNLVWPFNPIVLNIDKQVIDTTFTEDDIRNNFKKLNKIVRSFGANIPPLVSAYVNLSNTMRTFGTSVNDVFGNVEETGILVTVADLIEEKKVRYFESFVHDPNKVKARIELK
ncbi:MAG: GNAT family N-acetyltransferase [Bacteroidales bacterium]|jgi:hypothetical protein|nr:GNAT family N-acetyltransferase [Bacteroidales bacterium]